MASVSVRPGDARRRFLRRALTLGGLAAVWRDAGLARLLAQEACGGEPLGEFVHLLPLYGAGSEATPLGTMVHGTGLDARLFTDLTRLAPDRLVTPPDAVFVRTATPPGLRHDPSTWQIALEAASRPTRRLTAADLVAAARPMGVHVMECAGNANPSNFGLMSAVAWDGVPLREVLDRQPRPAGASAILISGEDHAVQESRQSLPGASWVLPAQALDTQAPFLAVGMGGRPLTNDHGAPVRLVVPGWYGCTAIKWVRSIEWVGADAPATPQMLEFAFRTHQDGIPELARDYLAPEIDTAAMPVRVEQRRVAGAVEYRIVGIVWGGMRPVDRLLIRFGSREAGTPVRVCPAPSTHHTWSLWSHRWRPTEPGYYDISLKVADPTVRTRRLDLSFYIRRVKIDEV